MARDSFVFYESFHVALSKLDDSAYKTIMIAICEYALYGTEPELDGMLTLAFDLIKPQIDANTKRYEDGKKGGRPPKKTSKPVVSELKTSGYETENQWLSESKPNVNVNVNVNDNVNDNDNVNVNVVDSDTHNTQIPTYTEISLYCSDKGYQIDIDKFIKYNAGRGWSLEWKSAVDLWAQKDKDKKKEERNKNRFNNFQNSQPYDFAAIEAAALARAREG